MFSLTTQKHMHGKYQFKIIVWAYVPLYVGGWVFLPYDVVTKDKRHYKNGNWKERAQQTIAKPNAKV